MIVPESVSIDVKRRLPGMKEVSPDRGEAVSGFAQRELSGEERAKLLDVKAWDPILEMYGRTMKLAVALTDPKDAFWEHATTLSPCGAPFAAQ